MIDGCIFPTLLNLANVTPVYKKAQRIQRKVTGRYVSCQISQKFTKGAFLSQFKFYFENISSKFQTGFKQGPVHNSV